MNGVNKTLYIPLYGKASVSRRGLLLEDKKAEEIWAAEGFALGRKARSKWLSYNMAMRSAVFDRWLEAAMEQLPDAVIIHVGCGMDSRITRVGDRGRQWFDVDFPEVISQRRRYFRETENYHMISSDIRQEGWLSQIPSAGGAIIVMEGISMYLQVEQLKAVLSRWKTYFQDVRILMDSYTVLGARATKYKNPINDVGVTTVYGFDDPREMTAGTGLTFLGERELSPEWLISQLPEKERKFYRTMFAGKMAGKLYRLYEYQ